MALLDQVFTERPLTAESLGLGGTVALLRELHELRAALMPKPKRGAGSLLLSKREAAKRLGVDRNKGLAALIESGQLHVVKKNGLDAIPVGEVERLASEGYDTSARAPHVRRRGVRRNKPAPVSAWKLKV